MGCGCNKAKGSKATPASTTAAKAVRTAQAQQKANMAANAPMKGKTQKFALELRDGRTMRFGSKLEADAENVRQGYTGTVKPA